MYGIGTLEIDMTRFGFLTDTHFSVVRNDFRTDSYFESVLGKFRQCYEHFREEGCEFIVHGGDMFDRYRSCSNQMIVEIRKVIMSSSIPTYFIWGQHDLLGYNRQSGSGSNLEFLRKICDGMLVEIGGFVDVGGVRIYASHVDDDPVKILQGIQPCGKPSVCIVHALLYSGKSMFDCIDVGSIGKIEPVLVLSGGLHCGFGRVDSNGTTYYNPGSLARTSREDRRPKGCVVEIEGNGCVFIEDFLPVCADYPFPADDKDTETEIEQDSPEFIEDFEKFRSESRDIFERLEKVGNAHKISRDILEYIKSKQK